jgi:hypothetical protein
MAMKKIILGTVGMLLFSTGPVLAASSMVSSTPQVKTEHDISYVSGGVGKDERESLRKIAKDDNLELSFALQNKEYLGGADVVIKDNNGKDLLTAVSDGPLFFAKLPAGTYTVEATAQGKTETQLAHVTPSGQDRVYFTWKASDAHKRTGSEVTYNSATSRTVAKGLDEWGYSAEDWQRDPFYNNHW